MSTVVEAVEENMMDKDNEYRCGMLGGWHYHTWFDLSTYENSRPVGGREFNESKVSWALSAYVE